jgi:hypothetical protein
VQRQRWPCGQSQDVWCQDDDGSVHCQHLGAKYSAGDERNRESAILDNRREATKDWRAFIIEHQAAHW